MRAVAILLVLLWPIAAAAQGGYAGYTGTTRNVTCSGDISSALGTAISNSSDGDIVNIGSGSCSTGTQSWTNKNILITGQGQGVTNLDLGTGGWIAVTVTGTNEPRFRITALSATTTCGSCIFLKITAQSATSVKRRGPFRLDHVTYVANSNAADGGFYTGFGPIWGVIDQNNAKMDGEALILTDDSIDGEDGSFANGLYGAWGTSQAFTPGGEEQLYIENNDFSCDEPTNAGKFLSAIDTFYRGGRVVFRYNRLICTGLYAHWTQNGNLNTLWWEVYGNTFDRTGGSLDVWPARLQGGGTGVFYDNTFKGYSGNLFILANEQRQTNGNGNSGSPLNYCDQGNDWDGSSDPDVAGWPCISQTGRCAGKTVAQIRSGDRQASCPLYLWNNGQQDKCANAAAGGSACDNLFTVRNENDYLSSSPHTTSGFGNGDVDWSKTSSQPSGAGTATLTYTACAYPHPLVSGTGAGTCGGGVAPPETSAGVSRAKFLRRGGLR